MPDDQSNPGRSNPKHRRKLLISADDEVFLRNKAIRYLKSQRDFHAPEKRFECETTQVIDYILAVLESLKGERNA